MVRFHRAPIRSDAKKASIMCLVCKFCGYMEATATLCNHASRVGQLFGTKYKRLYRLLTPIRFRSMYMMISGSVQLRHYPDGAFVKNTSLRNTPTSTNRLTSHRRKFVLSYRIAPNSFHRARYELLEETIYDTTSSVLFFK